MATLKQLEEQRDELEARLEAGDPAAESALARLDYYYYYYYYYYIYDYY